MANTFYRAIYWSKNTPQIVCVSRGTKPTRKAMREYMLKIWADNGVRSDDKILQIVPNLPWFGATHKVQPQD